MVLFGRCMGWCMVKGIWLLFQSSRHQEAIRLKGRPSWSQAAGCAPWSILQPKKLHILCHHLTWIAAVLLVITHGKQGLVKWEPRQTWHCSWQAQCSFAQNCNITKLSFLVISYVGLCLMVYQISAWLSLYKQPINYGWYRNFDSLLCIVIVKILYIHVNT